MEDIAKIIISMSDSKEQLKKEINALDKVIKISTGAHKEVFTATRNLINSVYENYDVFLEESSRGAKDYE